MQIAVYFVLVWTVVQSTMSDKKTPLKQTQAFKEKEKALHARYKDYRDSDTLKFLRRDYERLAKELVLLNTQANKAEREYAAIAKPIVDSLVAEAKKNDIVFFEVVRESVGKRKSVGYFTSSELADKRVEEEKKVDKDKGKVATYKISSFVPTGNEKIEVLDVTAPWTL